MNANEMREVTAEELEAVEGGNFLNVFRKMGDFLCSLAPSVELSDVTLGSTEDRSSTSLN